jgi:hypothetical protein
MRVKAAALIIGLPLFLLSCEKDLGERGSGKKVTINFTVSNEGYGADQQIMKSAGAKEAKPETVYIPLNNNYFMAATLTPEPAEEVRATAEFAIGQKMRFVAYDGAVEDDSAIYTWDGSKFVPDGEPLGVEPDNGVTYHFVAYSFFGDPLTEPDDEDVEEEILPAQDVVWGEKNQKIYDTFADRTVEIEMKHKFSRVRVKVDASSITDAQVTDVSGVVIAGGKKANLTVATGSLAASSAAGADVTATMTNWVSVDGGKARLSGYKVFYPSLTTITLATLDLEIDEVPLPLTNKSVTFSQTLAANTSYTVTVDVRANRWAWSNIYWTVSALTFDRTNQGNQNYQGVFFKWGSLVGISPVGTDPILYIPPVGGGSWDSSHKMKDHNLPWATVGSWANMPHTTTSNSAGYGQGGNYLYLNPDFSNYKGDICNYIDNAWRMPNSGEFYGTVSSYSFAYSDPENATGRGSMGSDGATVNFVYGIRFFSASGQRFDTGPSNVGGSGEYGTGSTDSGGGAYMLHSGGISLTIYSGSRGERANAVRCIKKLPTD